MQRNISLKQAQCAHDNTPSETVDVDALMQADVREANGDVDALAYYRAQWEANGWQESSATCALASHLASLATTVDDAIARLSAKGRAVSTSDWRARFAYSLPAYGDGMPTERERMDRFHALIRDDIRADIDTGFDRF